MRLDFKEDSCGRLGLGLVVGDRCAEVRIEEGWGVDTKEYLIRDEYIMLTSMKYEFQIKLFIGYLSKQQNSISFR